MRLTLSWPSADRLPTVIVAIARQPATMGQGVSIAAPPGRAVAAAERVGEEADQDGEAGRLGADREERGDRRRRALVDVGRPHVERRGADLVAEAGQHADDADEHDLGHLALRGRERGDARGDLAQVERLGEPEDPAHAVEHDPRGHAAEDDVLERRLRSTCRR